MSDNRVLPLEGIHNFRDYGGYAVSGGGRLRRGTLWRSGQHHGATDADLERIAALNLKSVFDLRTARERSSHPCRRPDGFDATVHFAEDTSEMHAPHIAAAGGVRAGMRDAASAREGMRRNYGTLLFRPELVEMMRRYLAGLAEGKGPSLINCMAGKDRTGLAVAMLHLATGVHRDDIIADYVLTNTAGDMEARIAAGMATITIVTGEQSEEVLRVLMGVEPEYLESAFATIEERHGSADAYLRDVLGADDALRARLREVLVET